MKWGLAAIAVLAVACAGAARGSSSPWSGVAIVWVRGDGALWGMRDDGRGARALGVHIIAGGAARTFSWSRDGKRFAFVDRRGVVVLDTATGRRTRVRGASSPPCDGHISLGVPGRLLCDDGESGHPWMIDGGHARNLDDGALSLRDSTWGPRALIAAAYSTGEIGVYRLGPPFRRIASVPGSGSDPAWAPDGRRIAFDESEGERSSLDQVWIGTIGAKRARYLGRGAHPSFSPDGRAIVYDRAGDIFVMRADGSDVRRVTHRRGADAMPLWRPR